MREAHAEEMRNRRLQYRREMLAEYGGKCACCGESDPRKLTMDHIDGSGHLHRKGPRRERKGYIVAVELRRQGWPKANYQLLCWSCNSVKHFYPGQECCPK